MQKLSSLEETVRQHAEEKVAREEELLKEREKTDQEKLQLAEVKDHLEVRGAFCTLYPRGIRKLQALI